MDELKTVIDKLPLPVLIWKLGELEGDPICIYSNIYTVNNFEDHIGRFTLDVAQNYRDFVKNGGRVEMETTKNSILLEFVNSNTFYEWHNQLNSTDYIFSAISSKLRNPLTNIIGMISLIESIPVNDENFLKYIDIIKESTSNILKLTNDIVDILNIKQNNIIVKKEEINAEELLKECLAIIAKDAQKKGVNLFFRVSKKLPKIIYADKGKLKQIINNMLENSMRFTVNGNIAIIMSENKSGSDTPFAFTEVNPPKLNVMFKIRDTGIGINDSKKKFLDAILGISKNGGMKTYKLNGFGMYISKHLCSTMEGNIWYKSEEDIGTIFYFNIICETFRTFN